MGNAKKYALLPALAGLLFLISSCTTGLPLMMTPVAGEKDAPWKDLYVSGMNGVENLAFDGQGRMYVTGLDGMLYLVEPAGSPFLGKISRKRYMGKILLGVEWGPDGWLYVAVEEDDAKEGERRVYRVSADLAQAVPLGKPIQGLNGFARDSEGYLYMASSDQKVLNPQGKILRARMGDDASFDNPEVFVEREGLINGLAFSPDEKTLYFTEMLGGVWTVNMETRKKGKIWGPGGLLQILDDLDTGPDGDLYVCLNSERSIVRLSPDGEPKERYRIQGMGAPSSCLFGRGPGFDTGTLYITEFGLEGRVLTMNGRGLWAMPLDRPGAFELVTPNH